MINKDKRALAVTRYREKPMPMTKTGAVMGISMPTLYAYVEAAQSTTA